MRELSDSELRDTLRDVLINDLELGNRLLYIADNYPDLRSLEVEAERLSTAMPPSGGVVYFITHPRQFIEQAERVIDDFLGESYEDVHINFRITGLLEAHKRKIKALRQRDLGRFIRIDGLVSQTTEIVPEIKKSVWRCRRCGYEMEEEAEREPFKCYDGRDDDGCGKPSNKTSFELLYDKCDYIDYQQIEVQDPPEELRGGEEPENITCRLRDDIVAKVAPGDHITMTGVLAGEKKNSKSKTLSLYFKVNSIQVKNTAFDELEVTEEEKEELEEMGENENILDDIVDSIAPSIHGMRKIKNGLALQLFGGVRKELTDGSHRRGDIHILMVGDPGTAKSKLLEYMANISPRGIFSSGKGTTAAGLTAAATQENILGENKWTLKAGTLVLADKGLAAIDELDKMSTDDRDSLHDAMEQQIITQDKAGIHARFNSRTSLLAACNPTESRFERHVKISEQIGLPSSLISRFDLIFPIVDKVDEEKDRRLARYMLKLHREGQRLQKEKDYEGEKKYSPKIPVDKLKKYISYAKTINPEFTDEAMYMLENYYVEMRRKSDDKRVAITPRQMESMVRMAEASARIHLRDRVVNKDANMAINMMRYFLKEVVETEEGLDIDLVLSEDTAKDRTIMQIIRDLLINMKDRYPNGVPRGQLEQEVEYEGVKPFEFEKELEKMKRNGMIYEPSQNHYLLSS